MIQWLKDRAINALIYGVIILTVGFLLYSAFLKPTSNQKTTIQDGGVQIEYWKDSKISPSFGGCVSLQAEKYREKK